MKYILQDTKANLYYAQDGTWVADVSLIGGWCAFGGSHLGGLAVLQLTFGEVINHNDLGETRRGRILHCY